jgi:Flp pilus assembly protein TadG
MTAEKKSRGQALIEFTLLLPLILILVGGLTDVGLAFFVSTSMENAVREGARLRATGVADVTTQVRDRIYAHGMFTGGTGGIAVTQPPAVAEITACSDQQSSVSVTASGQYNYMFLNLVGISSTTMSRTATMRLEQGTDLCK